MSIFYNHTHKLVLIHIPKCGGLSIRKFSNIHFDGPYFIKPDIKKYIDYTIVGMCRHPIDRFISAIKMFMYGTDCCFTSKNPYIPNLNVDYAISILLNKSIPSNFSYDAKLIPNSIFEKQKVLKHHIIPITDPSNYIDCAKYIIRYESYADDCKKIFNMLGINKINIPHKNISKKNKKIILNKNQREILNSVYKQDFITFGYKL